MQTDMSYIIFSVFCGKKKEVLQRTNIAIYDQQQGEARK